MNQNYTRALALIDLNRYSDALPYLRKSLAEAPNDAEVHANIALCELNLKKFDQARTTVSRALELNPEHAHAHFLLAWGHAELGFADKAQVEVKEAIRLDATSPDYFALLVHLLIDAGKLSEAEKSLEDGLSLAPSHSRLLTLKVELLHQKDMPRAAQKAMKEALNAAPDDSDVHSTKGWIAFESGNLRVARACFLEALRIDAEYHPARVGLWYTQLSPFALMQPLLLFMRFAWPPRRDYRSVFPMVHFIAFCILGYVSFSRGIAWWWWAFWAISLFKMPYRWLRDAYTPLTIYYLSRDSAGSPWLIPESKGASIRIAIIHSISFCSVAAGYITAKPILIAYGILLDLILSPHTCQVLLNASSAMNVMRTLSAILQAVVLYFALDWVYRDAGGNPDFSRFVLIWFAFLVWRYAIYILVAPFALLRKLTIKKA